MLARTRFAATLYGVAASCLVLAGGAQAQAATSPAASASAPKVGDLAPDFTLVGATRYGLLSTPVRLSDYRGQTVVLAFFYQARTKG